MDNVNEIAPIGCHVVVVPYPGRGHVNPMMNLCKSLVSSLTNSEIVITFVVTEEWKSLIGSDHGMPENVQFSTIPNVLPSELDRGSDFPGFYEAVNTKMEAPFETLLDRIQTPVTYIIADTEMLWVVRVANCRNIPVALLWTNSASVFSMFLHYDLIHQKGHSGADLLEHGEERIEFIPGVSWTRIADLPTLFHGNDERVLNLVLQCILMVKQAQYLLINTIYELESQAIDILRAKYSFPVHPIGPAIPFLDINKNPYTTSNKPNYIEWLDSQPRGSVLYVSLGSFLSVSQEQMEEIAAGLSNSGVRFLWVARGDNPWLRQNSVKGGFVVSWCEQLRVLCHSSVGGFLSHSGWNSILEALFAGVPMLTFPVYFDQTPNSKQVAEDWKVGWQARRGLGAKTTVKRKEIAELVRRFMNSESNEGKDLRKYTKDAQEICRRAIAEGGSSVKNLNAFLQDVMQGKGACAGSQTPIISPS